MYSAYALDCLFNLKVFDHFFFVEMHDLFMNLSSIDDHGQILWITFELGIIILVHLVCSDVKLLTQLIPIHSSDVICAGVG